MLIEKHILALPAVSIEDTAEPGRPLHLNKNLPLMIVADYLSGKQSKEQLIDILQHIQNGRHYYWHYHVPVEAPLGKYTLLSEVVSEGEIRYSKTAADDHFFVEKLHANYRGYDHGLYYSLIHNPSSEGLPVKILDYAPGSRLSQDQVHAFELRPGETRELELRSRYAYVAYCEERELIPLRPLGTATVFRNTDWLRLNKADQIYLVHRTDDVAYTLTPEQRELWLALNGIRAAEELKEAYSGAYGELIAANVINEISEE